MEYFPQWEDSGTVKKKLTSPTKIKDHKVSASEDDPHSSSKARSPARRGAQAAFAKKVTTENKGEERANITSKPIRPASLTLIDPNTPDLPAGRPLARRRSAIRPRPTAGSVPHSTEPIPQYPPRAVLTRERRLNQS